MQIGLAAAVVVQEEEGEEEEEEEEEETGGGCGGGQRMTWATAPCDPVTPRHHDDTTGTERYRNRTQLAL
jgi:hypothetical protein